MRRTTSFLVFLVFLPVFLVANAGGEEHSYDIKHYDLTIEPDFKTRSVTLQASIRISNPKLENAFRFGLNDGFTWVKATSDVSVVSLERDPEYVTVFVEKPASDFQLFFEISGSPGRSNDENRDMVADSSLFLLWSDRFYPIDFNDWATVRTRLILPAMFKAIAPGRLVDTRTTRDRVEYVFQTTTPAVCFSVIADSRWVKTSRKTRFLHMQTLLYPQSQRFAERILSTSYDVIAFYSQTYCLYPFDQFTVVTIDGINARRAFPGFVGYSPEYMEKELAATGRDAHETALMWWDYTIRGSGPGGFQWTEGFGDYAEFLYAEQRGEPIPEIFGVFKDRYLALTVDQEPSYSELSGRTPQEIVHGKYPWLMRVMHYVVGDIGFKNAMQLLFYKFRYHTLTMSEFVSTLEEGCGQSLKWWREEWLERKGVPTVSIKFKIEPVKREYRVTVLLKQSGPLYHLPIEIGIRTAKGLRIEKVNLSLQEMSFTFKSVDKPESVVLDPNGWVLMRKIYEE